MVDMRLLLIEDNPATAASIEIMLRAANFIVDSTDLGKDGLERSKLYDYDIIILDLMLPDMDGYEVLHRLRATKVRTPILILSGLGSAGADFKIKALGFGADDFLPKPFDSRELIARIRAITRRSKGSTDSAIRVGKILIHIERQMAEVDGERVPLTRKEYDMLELLSLRKGMAITKEMFLDHLYGGMDEPDFRIIDVFMSKLRKKLSQATGGDNYIETVWGRGYVLRDPAASVALREHSLASA
jgi:two-component system cell cycle response regulator CtrA